MILDNARIYTMDDALPRSSALAIAGGRVIGGVDSREDVIASHAHERIDLQGMTVVPGFVDAHVHFRAWALARVRLSLRDVPAFDALCDAVASHEGEWVLGSGWHDGVARGVQDAGERLHDAAGGRPVALVSHDGHALLVTTAALRELGIDDHDLEVPGGIVERDGNGTFTGLLRERSAWLVRRELPEHDLTTAAMAAAMREANRRGVTCVHDMDGARGMRSWATLDRERGLRLRVVQHFLVDDLPHLEALGVPGGFGSDRLRVGGLKVFADGTLGSGTAWLHEPEHGSDARTPVTITDTREIEDLSRRAAGVGLATLVHAIGDAAVTAVVDGLEASRESWEHLPARPRIEHAQLVRLEDLERCARLGIALSVQPTHLLTDRTLAEERWGDRCARAFAYRSMLEAGATVLLGSDAPIEDLDPLAAIDAAVTRGGWQTAQAIPALDALHACTAAPADAAGMHGVLGRLTPGNRADLVVLSDDPTERPARDIEVVATMVDGRWVAGRTNLRGS